MEVKGIHPLAEILAKKLFSIETVKPLEQRQMVARAISAAVRWHEKNKINCKCKEYKNMLEDVVNELDLSELAIEKHGPMGTPPAELVRLVLEEKDRIILGLKNGFGIIHA